MVYLLCQALRCIGDLIAGHPKNLDILTSKVLGTEPQVEPAMNSILRILLRTSSMQEFIAADYIFKNFCEVAYFIRFLFMYIIASWPCMCKHRFNLLLLVCSISFESEKCRWPNNVSIHVNSSAAFNDSCSPWGRCEHVIWKVCLFCVHWGLHFTVDLSVLSFVSILDYVTWIEHRSWHSFHFYFEKATFDELTILKVFSPAACYCAVLHWVKMMVISR